MSDTMIKIPTDKVTIVYAPVRGLGAAICMICSYSGEPFDVKHYEGIENKLGVDDWREGWWVDKPKLSEKNSFINIPYVIDGETIVTQSNAVLTYLGRKYKLLGSTDAELTLAEQALCEIIDLRNKVVGICYGPGETYETSAREHFASTLPMYYEKFDKWLAQKGTAFLACNTITAPDFHLWEMLDQHETWSASLGLPLPLDSKEDPRLKGYFEGPYYKCTINAKRAHFF